MKKELLHQVKTTTRLEEKVTKYQEYSDRLKDEKRKLENEIMSMEQFTKNI